MKSSSLSLATALSISLASAVYGAPFGLSMGMQLDDFDLIELSELGSNEYIANSLPRNHSAFEWELYRLVDKGLHVVTFRNDRPNI